MKRNKGLNLNGGFLMKKGNIRHMFLGGNTSQGFFSYYDYILNQDDAERIFVIKGGPGVGKSTIMKQIGSEMIKRGYNVEFMHCSSDSNSLDGVVIPEIRVALLDGTAPHLVDPKNPGAIDEIIYLGDFWDEKGMRKNRKNILSGNNRVESLFARSYRYLKAAACMHEDCAHIYEAAIDRGAVNVATKDLLDNIFGSKDIASREGKQRHLFASAITPAGLKNYLDTLFFTEKVYIINTLPGISTHNIIERAKTAAVERGLYVECYHCALFPERLEHIVIPEINASISTSNKYHSVNINAHKEVDMSTFLDLHVLGIDSEVLEYNMGQFEELLNKAIDTIKKAKMAHDKMEEYYIPNMDFEAVQRCRESIMYRILDYSGI